MNTEDKIKALIEKRYSSYRGLKFKEIEKVHTKMRSLMSDEQFLQFLEKTEKELPRPIYKNPL